MSRWCFFRGMSLAVLSAFSPAVASLKAESIFSKPVAVISLGKLDNVQPDIIYMMRAVGSPQIGGFVNIMVDQYSQGLDRERPAGFLVAMQGETPAFLAYMPLSDFDKFIEALQAFGEPDDLGEGKYAMEVGANTVFAKKSDKWLYVAMDEGLLEDLPEDPTKLSTPTEEQYELSARLMVQNVPTEIKSMILDQLKNSLDQAMAAQSEGQSDEDQDKAAEAGEQTIASLEKSMEEMSELMIGWNIDSSAKKTYLDFGVQAVEGSQMATDMVKQQEVTTEFPGFSQNGAAATFRFGSALAEKDRPQTVTSLDTAKAQLLAQIEENEQIPEGKGKDVAKDFVEKLFALLTKTVEEGVFDGGATVLLDGEKLRGVLGGRIADGNQLANDVKSIFKEVEDVPEVPKVNFDAYKHQNVTFHTVTVPVQNAEGAVEKILGTELPLVIGTGDKSFYLGFGAGCEDLLKAVLDKNAADGATKVSPLELSVEVGQILRYAQSVESNPFLDMAAEAIQDFSGKDHVMVQSRPIPRGLVYRLTVEEGVLRAAGSLSQGNAQE